MSHTLAQYLVDHNVVSATRMDDLLQRQALFGGSLDTNILEMGLIDEHSVLAALAEFYQLPLATAKLLAKRDSRISNVFPARLAKKYQVVPLAMSGRSLIVLASCAPSTRVINEIKFMLSLPVKIYLVSEARFNLLLRDWMGVEIDARYASLEEGITPLRELASDDRETSSEKNKLLTDLTQDEKELTELDVPQTEEQKSQEQTRVEQINLNDALQICAQAHDQNEIVDVILRFARQFVNYAGLFVLKDNMVSGWNALGELDSRSRIRGIHFPASTPSILNTVIRTRSYYLGPIPDTTINNQLLQSLGRSTPKNVLIVPVLVQQRIIGVLFTDAGQAGIDSSGVSELLVFVAKLSSAFEKLIRKNKLERKPTPQPKPGSARPEQEPEQEMEEQKERKAEEKSEEVESSIPWQDLVTQPIPTPASQAVSNVSERITRLVQDLISPEIEKARAACALLCKIGSQALEQVMIHFPGHLLINVRDVYECDLPLSDHSALLEYLVEMGSDACKAVTQKLEHPNALVRYYAVQMLGETRCNHVLLRLSERLYDSDTHIRTSAIKVLQTYHNVPAFNTLLEKIRSHLYDKDPSEQSIAAALVGNLKDINAVPELIGLVDVKNKMVSQTATESLCYITKQNFGTNKRKWHTWWRTNKTQNRVEWLIVGLESKVQDIRASSIQELRQITGKNFGYVFDGTKTERKKIIRKWKQWWKTSNS